MATLHRSFPIARKDRRCDTCGTPGAIRRGDRYYRWKGTSDAWQGIATLHECVDCALRYGRADATNEEQV